MHSFISHDYCHCFNFFVGLLVVYAFDKNFLKVHQHIIFHDKNTLVLQNHTSIYVLCSYLCEIQMPIVPHPLLVSRLLLLPSMA